MVKMTIDAEKVDTFRADERGRVNLGTEYAHEDVEIAVIGLEGREECEDE